MTAALQKLWQQVPGPLQHVFSCASFWALLAGAIGIWLLLPARLRYGKTLGGLLVALAAGLLAYDLPLLGDWTSQAVLWLLAAVTLGGAIATIASQSPVYSAIWFALSLLGTAGLFLFQGAQFLAGATVVVYAGAIVVTFLFVIMLAQPEGHSAYDRLTWGGLPKILGVATAGLLLGILTFMLGGLKQQSATSATSAAPAAHVAASATADVRTAADGVLTQDHVALLGRHLFGEHLLSVEVAGTLLLVALVGAVAIAIQGRPRLAERIEEALR
jgi:NADH-quinone oxidoreductase subunit J